MPWDPVTGEERVNPQGYGRKPQPRPGYGGVFKGAMPAAPSGPLQPKGPLPPDIGDMLTRTGQVGGGGTGIGPGAVRAPQPVASTLPYQRPGGGLFGLGQAGAAGTPIAPGPPGLPNKPLGPSPALPAAAGLSGAPPMPKTAPGGIGQVLGAAGGALGGMLGRGAPSGQPDPREALLRQLMLK